MTIPAVTVRAAFGSDAMAASPTWTDLSARVLSVSTSRGRSSVSEAFGPGTATVIFDNADRDLDPSNLSGTYVSGGATQILPNVRVEITAVHDAVTHHLATVWADSWTNTWTKQTSTVTMTGTDGSKFLGRVDLAEQASVGDGEYGGQRIGRVLDLADWPAGLRDLDTGSTQIPGLTGGEAARQHIDRVVYAERGGFFFAGDGSATFVDRYQQFLDPNRTSAAATFSDASGHAGPRWSTVAPVVMDDTRLVNSVTVAREGGQPQTSEDAASIATYGRITGSDVSDLLVLDDIEAQHVADWWLMLNSEPYARVDTVTVRPIGTGSDEYEHAVARELRDRITVAVTPPGGGTIFSQDSFIESISHNVTASAWETTWGLSPVDRYGFTDSDDWMVVDSGQVDIDKVAP